MSSGQGSTPDGQEPREESDEAAALRLRWVGRLAVVALGLWFIADGLRRSWAPAGTVGKVLMVAVVVLVVAFLVLFFRNRRRGPD